jgi:hypothetical protein
VNLQGAGESVHFPPAFNFIKKLESPSVLRDPVYKKTEGLLFLWWSFLAKTGNFPTKNATIWCKSTLNGETKAEKPLVGAFRPTSSVAPMTQPHRVLWRAVTNFTGGQPHLYVTTTISLAEFIFMKKGQ